MEQININHSLKLKKLFFSFNFQKIIHYNEIVPNLIKNSNAIPRIIL